MFRARYVHYCALAINKFCDTIENICDAARGNLPERPEANFTEQTEKRCLDFELRIS